MLKRILYVLIAASVFAGVSCNGKWFEDKKNTDTLFLGISLGMGKKEFYDYCWQMNRDSIFLHGPANQEVEYKLIDNGVNAPVLMRFYPNFYQDKVYEMPVLFKYEAWAPWNRGHQSDSLLIDMLDIFKTWYGEEFKIVQHPTQGPVYVRRDDNRRINLFIRDDQFVQAVFTDVKVEKKMIDEQNAGK